MSESYGSKRGRWQRLLESLPAELRGHVSLRNAEAVASLTPQAQQRLAEAVRSGLKRLPRAVEQLRVDPNTPLAELLNPPAQSWSTPYRELEGDVQNELAHLIQGCFPQMPRLSAEALASADVMGNARQVAQAHQALLKSNQLRTEFVMVVVYTLVWRTLERLDAIVAENPGLQQALDCAPLSCEPHIRRRQDA